jgi:Flp pilus assembly protein CpaB
MPAPVRARRRNIPLGVLGVLILLGSALGGLVWSRDATSRVEVLVAARDIPAGRRVAESDLRTVRVSIDGTVSTIDAVQRTSVVGQVAAVPIPSGALLAPSEIGHDAALADDEAVVGVVLAPGASPTADLRAGDRVAVFDANKATGSTGSDGGASALTIATVYAVDRLSSSSGLAVSLRVPAAAAARVVAAAAGDRVRLVLLPPGGSLPGAGG